MANIFKEKYPLLFRNEDPMQPINMFGIECRKGWYNILNAAFGTLYSEYNSLKHGFNFWKNLEPDERYPQSTIDETILDHENRLKKAEEKLPIVEQCKEKFGTLRLYCSNLNDFSKGVVYMAETMSESTCEVCGNVGKSSGRRWISTLCPECTEKRDNNLTSPEPVLNS